MICGALSESNSKNDAEPILWKYDYQSIAFGYDVLLYWHQRELQSPSHRMTCLFHQTGQRLSESLSIIQNLWTTENLMRLG
jgi:hypothetical protein